jgi:N-acetylneuraminic acid mutarotase
MGVDSFGQEILTNIFFNKSRNLYKNPFLCSLTNLLVVPIMNDKRVVLLLLLLMLSFILVPPLGVEGAATDSGAVLAFLQDVVFLDLTRYDVQLLGLMARNYDGYIQESGKYTLESAESTIDVLFKFRNQVLSWVLLRAEGSLLYVQPPSTNVLVMVDAFLQRYQEFSGDSDAATVRAILSDFDEIQNITTTVDNIIIKISSDPASTSVSWNYKYYGLEYPVGVSFHFENGVFYTFRDDRMFYSVGDPTLNVSEEEAIGVALEHAEALALNASDHEWTSFDIREEAITTELDVATRESHVYFPYWSVTLPQYNPYVGYIGRITVTVWADNGLVSVETTPAIVTATSYSGVLSGDEYAWSSLTPMPTARSGLGVAVVDGKIYAIGGYDGSYLAVNEMYDPENDMWITKASMPTARKDIAVAVYQNKIYVFGGTTASSNSEISGYTGVTEVYDPATDTWESKTSMPTLRSSLCANVVNGRIYLIGGATYINGGAFFSAESNINEVYNPTTDTWTTKTPMPKGAWNYVSAVIENKIYLIGGLQRVFFWLGATTSLKLNQVYDPENDTWSSGKSVPIDVSNGACGATTGVLLPKGIFVSGGNQLSTGSKLNQMYNPENDTWFIGAQMPTPRFGFGVAVVNDELYVIGGKSEGNYLAVNERYTLAEYIPESPSWIILPLLLVASVLIIFCKKWLTHKPSNS